MSKVYYDFHIHTGLSPCGDDDMSPNNIVNMALLNGLDAIAITDHNTCGNVRAVMRAAQDTGLLVIPGMELETAEETHIICLFQALAQALAFAAAVEEHMPKITNRVAIYGRQCYFDDKDEITGFCEHLLVTATSLPLSEAAALVRAHGGAVVPAHVDRGSYSVISNLGFIPPDLDVCNIEISRAIEPDAFFTQFARALPREYGYIRSSDAHYLGDISERVHAIEIEGTPTAEKIIGALNHTKVNRRSYID